MKIILLQDVPKVGKKWEVKTVADGFARNHLFPKGLATAATATALRELEVQIAKDTKVAEEELENTQKLASNLDGLEVEIPTKISPGGEAYKGVSAQMISKILDSMGYKVTKDQIDLKKPLKQVGDYSVTVNLKHNLEAEIKVAVIDEEEDKNKEPTD